MRIRYRPPSHRHDRGARPVQGPGAGLYSAGRGFAPPGSTKPADAVFALRVTIPVAFARVARCALRLRVHAARPVALRRRGSVAPLPSPAALSPRANAHRGASLRSAAARAHIDRSFRRLRPRLASGSALTRHRRTLAAPPHSQCCPPQNRSPLFERRFAACRPALRAFAPAALRTDPCLPPSPPPAPRTSPFCPAALPCRGRS